MKKMSLLLLSGLLIACMAGSAIAMPGDIELWNKDFTYRIDGADNSHPSVPIHNGESVTISVKVNYVDQGTPNEIGDYTYDATIVQYGGGAAAGDYTISKKAGFSLTAGGNPFKDAEAITVTCNKDLPNGAYCKIKVGDATAVLASGSAYVKNIPEFPTVALPVAAVLGLVFVFGRKKEGL